MEAVIGSDIQRALWQLGDWERERSDHGGALSALECVELERVVRRAGPIWALEVGHYTGLSTCVLLHALRHGAGLVTIDHHLGDRWSGPTSSEAYLARVSRFRRPGVYFRAVFKDMQEAALALWSEIHVDGGPAFDFVFYDADHTRRAVDDFWRLYAPLVSRRCLLVYDDGDWADQSYLGELASAQGFRSVREIPFHRGPGDKRAMTTYTLEIMERT